MSVDTKGILRNGISIDDIASALSNKNKNIVIYSSSSEYHFRIAYFDEVDKKQRVLSVSLDSEACLRDNHIKGVAVSLGNWGNSVECITYLCETFGGYIDENDCDDEGFYAINEELFLQGHEHSELEIFRHKVIQKFSIDRVTEIMELCEEYKEKFK